MAGEAPSTCPKCGCAARVAILRRERVRCELRLDGTVGRVLSASREAPEVDSYECGGGHVWKKNKETTT